MIFSVVLSALLGLSAAADLHYYDTFTSTEITHKQYLKYVASGKTTYCVVETTKCDPDEGRRLDNTCNNLKFPVKGARFTVNKRLLPAAFAANNTPRLAKSGKALPLSRKVRTTLIAEGEVPNQYFTHLVTNFWVFMALDSTLSQDTLNYVINIPICCTPAGKNQSLCAPNPIPSDDPVHRFSEVRCMNMTIPTTYQNQGCAADPKGTPDRLNAATPSMDMSFLYGGIPNATLAKRLNDSGLLMFEVDENKKVWPPSIKTNPEKTCRLNEPPNEVRCHDTPVPVTNTILGANLFLIWWWRHHNFIARKLKAVNPSWDDDKLFYTARDINIAYATQIYYYEHLPLMFGRQRMINDGAIVADGGFRDLYNDTIPPYMTHEYLYALRWVHTIQEGSVKMYDTDGFYVKEIPIGNLTFRTGYLAVDKNLDYITQGVFRQPCAAADYIVDPIVSELSLGALQRSLDLLVNDNAKSRYLGLQPYIKYREYCTGKKYSTWDDLKDVIDPQRIEMLQKVYEDVEDVELLAGIWLENLMEDAHTPPTMYCLVVQQLVRHVVTDRHWYERPNRPNAFTIAQLAEIRKATMSRFLCDIGDSVTKIQPTSFMRAGPGNEMTSCDNIPAMDFSAWEDLVNVDKN